MLICIHYTTSFAIFINQRGDVRLGDETPELLSLDNAFGLITTAHLLTQQTRQKNNERYNAKLLLIHFRVIRRIILTKKSLLLPRAFELPPL